MRSGTSLGRVRGLGSAREGAHHWWYQRLTAGSNFLLMLWLINATRGPSAAPSSIALTQIWNVSSAVVPSNVSTTGWAPAGMSMRPAAISAVVTGT